MSKKPRSTATVQRRGRIAPLKVPKNKGLTEEQAVQSTKLVHDDELREIYSCSIQLDVGESESFPTPELYFDPEYLNGMRSNIDSWFRRFTKRNGLTDRRYSLEISKVNYESFTVHCLKVK